MAGTVNYTPDNPDTCVPSSGLTCTYCKNKRLCNNVVTDTIKLPADVDDDLKKSHITVFS